MYYQNFSFEDIALYIVADDSAILAVERGHVQEERKNALTNRCAEELWEYFEGKRTSFTLPLAPKGTEFQKKVWQVLQEIPYGKVAAYSDVARAIGQPRACQAVGQAVGRNGVLILIPCHRVLGKDGSLTGFSAGIDLKIRLLEREKFPASSCNTGKNVV